MARARNIKPGFYKNEDLAECSCWARLLFPGLWMLADREGRLEDRPKRIKGELFPYDAFDVDPLLSELEQCGFIERYTADGKKVIAICKFAEHQSPHGKESDSELPDKDGNYTVHERNEKSGCVTGNFKTFSRQAQCQHETNTVQAQCQHETNTVQARPDSLNPDSLNPDSLNPDSLNPDSLNPDSGLSPSDEGEGARQPQTQKAKFKKPTKTDLHDLCESEKIMLDADRFIDHYEANGWMVGKSKMKDWKAAARNWARRELEFKKTSKIPTPNPRERPEYTYQPSNEKFSNMPVIEGERIE